MLAEVSASPRRLAPTPRGAPSRSWAKPEPGEAGEGRSERRKVGACVKGMQADQSRVMKPSIMSTPRTCDDLVEACAFVGAMGQPDESVTLGAGALGRAISSIEKSNNGSIDTSCLVAVGKIGKICRPRKRVVSRKPAGEEEALATVAAGAKAMKTRRSRN